MDVKERRKKVEELLNKKREAVDIAKTLGVPVRTIERDIEFINEHSKRRQAIISASVQTEIMLGRKKEEKPLEVKVKRSKQIAKRREEVARLYNEGKTAKEIAEEIGVSIQIVYQDIHILVEEKRIVKRERKSLTRSKKTKRIEQVAKRREEVVRLYNEGKTVDEISKKIGVSIATIYSDIKVLVEEKTIVKNTRRRTQDEKPEKTKGRKKEIQKRAAKRREEVARLYNEGKNVKEIAEELGVTIVTVYNDIKVLEAEEKIERHKIKRKKNTAKLTKRREEIARLYNEGKTPKEIAEKLGISLTVVYRDLKELENEEKIKRRKREVGERKRKNSNSPKINKSKKIEELFSKGKSYGEIADELDMSIIDVMRYLQQIKDVKEEKRINGDRKTNVKILYEEGKKISDIAKKLNISEVLVREDLLSFGIIPDLGIVSKRQEEKPEEQTLEEKTKNERALTDKKELLTSENRLLVIKERREKVAKLYDEGIEDDEIARTLNIPLRVIERDIDAILDARRFKDENFPENMGESISSSQSEEEQEIVTKRRNRIEELVKQGKNVKEIAEELGVEKSLIVQEMKYLMREGRIPRSYKKEFSKDRRERRKSNPKIIERREKVAKLYKEGKTVDEIAEELGIAIFIVQNDIKVLLKENVIEKRENNRKNRKPKSKEERTGNEEKEQTVKQRRENIRTKSEQKYYNSILKVIKMCIQSRDFKGAVEQIEMLKNEVKLSEEEKSKLDELLTAIMAKLHSYKVPKEDEKDR